MAKMQVVPNLRKALRVAMLIDAWFPFVGGGQIHVQNLKDNLEKRDVRVALFHSPSSQFFVRLLWSVWIVPQLLFEHAKEPFDLIHAHAFSAGIPGKIAGLVLNVPVVFTVHGSHLMDLKAKGLKAMLERLMLTDIRYDREISVTKAFTQLPNVNKDIAIIPNGVTTNVFDSVRAKKPKAFTFLYVGRDHPTKGLGFLKRAFTKLQRRYPTIRLKLITSGRITGRALVREYKRASAFVLPSLAEGQPIVLLEAWAAQLPVVATGTPGVKEIAKDGEDSILVKPGSTQALERGMEKLLKLSPSQRKRLAQQGYTKAKRDFTWARVAAQTLRVYQQAIRRI